MQSYIVLICLGFLCAIQGWSRPLSAIRKDAFTIGVREENPPFGKFKTPAERGFEYELAAELSNRIGAPRFRIVTIKSMSEGVEMLGKKKIDALIGTIKPNSEISAQFLVSNPYYQTSLAIATLASSKTVYSLTDLNGKYVAYTPDTKASLIVEKFIPKAKPEVVPSIEGGVDLLLKGEVEAVLHDKAVLAWLASTNKSIKLLPNNLSEDSYSILFDKQSSQLQTEVNTALQAMLVSAGSNTSPLAILCAKYGLPMTLREIAGAAPPVAPSAVPAATVVAPPSVAPVSNASSNKNLEERLNNALKMVDALKSELESLRRELK